MWSGSRSPAPGSRNRGRPAAQRFGPGWPAGTATRGSCRGQPASRRRLAQRSRAPSHGAASGVRRQLPARAPAQLARSHARPAAQIPTLGQAIDRCTVRPDGVGGGPGWGGRLARAASAVPLLLPPHRPRDVPTRDCHSALSIPHLAHPHYTMNFALTSAGSSHSNGSI